MNRLIIAKHLPEKDWVKFMRIIKEIENRYGVSIYHASPYPYERKTISSFNIGKLELCNKTRADVRKLRDHIEEIYNIAIYKMELSEDHKDHLRVGGLSGNSMDEREFRNFVRESSNQSVES